MRQSNFFQINLVLALFVTAIANRLPEDVIPKEYKLEIVTNLGDEGDKFSFSGTVWIRIACVTPTDTITMHSRDLTLNTDKVTLKASHESDSAPTISETVLEAENDFLKIKLSESLAPDKEYEVALEFEGELQEKQEGFFKSSYFDEDKKEHWLATTHFMPDNARSVFPCFDEPAFKANFNISLGRSNKYTSASNMPLEETVQMDDKPGWEWDRFKSTPPLSTYLVVFLVSDLHHENLSSFEQVVPIRVWATNTTMPKLLDFTVAIAPELTNFIQRYINITHTWLKQDVVALPHFEHGEMSHFGMVMFDEDYIPPDEFQSATRIASAVARGLVHHWFGGSVTEKWWSDYWFNECIVTYISVIIVKYTFIEWDLTSSMMNVYEFDSLESSKPLQTTIEDPKDVAKTFDEYAKKKGYYLVYMMGHFLGTETLRNSLHKYVDAYRYKNTQTNELLDFLTRQAHMNRALRQDIDLKTVMDTWFTEKSFPLITVTRDYIRGTIKVKQEKFSRHPDLLGTDTTTKWWVPLSYTTECELQFGDKGRMVQWLSPNDSSLTIDIGVTTLADWVMLNARGSGLYIVNYDETNWKYIINYLKLPSFANIPPLNRALLVHNAASLAWVGRVDYGIFLGLITYLQEQENDYHPWSVAVRCIDEVNALLMRTPVYPRFLNFVKILVSKANYEQYEHLQDMRAIVEMKRVSCKYEHKLCVANAQRQYAMRMNNQIQRDDISDEYVEMIYCTGIKYSDWSKWAVSWRDYQGTNRSFVRTAIANALGCTRNESQLRQLLDLSLDEASIRKADIPRVLLGVIENKAGLTIMRGFLDKNFDALYKSITPVVSEWSLIITTLSRHIVYDNEVKWFEDFLSQHQEYFSDLKRVVDIALETAKLNSQWLRNNYDSIADHLNNPVFVTPLTRKYYVRLNHVFEHP